MSCTLQSVIDLLKQWNLLKRFDLTIDRNTVFEYISDSSLDIRPNTLFFCKGAQFKAEYLKEALLQGAIVYVTEDESLLLAGNYFLVKDIRKAMSILASKFYEDAWRDIQLIGITGTKGKSTTAYMIKSVLDDYLKGSPHQCAILSSIENFNGKDLEESHLTTQEPIALHRLFFEMKKNNCKYCVMEVSSQALKYDRVFGINFEIGCFLNIGEDHISSIEHSSFEDYYRSKLKIFDYCDKVVVSDELPIEHPKALFCGRGKIDPKKPLHHRISDIRVSETAQKFILDPVGEITITMPGEFNIQNAAMAAIVCKEIGVPKGSILDGLYGARVSGRMELFRSERTGNVVIVDYAHNKLSYEALFDSIQKNYPNYRVVTIFGCPGKKAIKRRKDLPEIAERFSDFVYITEEDHGEEPLLKICDEIFENIYDKTKAEIELDRESALAKALARFEEPTLVLMLGKGRETRQKRGTTYVATPSDVELVEKYL